MKKILVCLVIGFSIFAVSCSTSAEKSIKELEAIVIQAEAGGIDTEREFDEILQNVELLHENIRMLNILPSNSVRLKF